MARTGFTSVDEYIRAQPKAVQPILRRVRRIIRATAPRAVESISYQLPAYSLAGVPLLCFAAWKEHFSLYPAGDALVEAVPELRPYRSSKGTLRFPLSEPVPVRLIERVTRFRAREARRKAARR